MAAWLTARPVGALEAQAVVAGRVVDAQTGNALAGARVVAGSREALAEADGSFRLQLPSGPASLTVIAPGHTPATVLVEAGDGKEIIVE